MKCKNCKHWTVIEEPDTIIKYLDYWTTDVPPVWIPPWTETIVNTGNHGECHAHPAQYMGPGNEPWRWPVTAKNKKCGEFVQETE